MNVVDNSGVRKLMCIWIIGVSNCCYVYIGDVIVVVIKEVILNIILERLEVVRVVIVCICKEFKCKNGMIIWYDDNVVVVID